MTRDWLALYPAMATKPKFRHLTPAGRGALLQVLILAAFQTPEATWDDADELRDSLGLEGFPMSAVDELFELGWIEVIDDGSVVIHDWDDHQLAATREAQRAWEAKRKTEWRRRKAAPSPAPHPLQEMK